MTRYDLLVFLHVAAVIIWLGAGFLLSLLVFGAARAGDRMAELRHHGDVEWLAPRLFIPASMGTLVLGILLVVDGPRSFGDLWIVVGLAGWAVSFVMGFFYFKPEGERIHALVVRHGPEHPEVDRRLQRLNVLDRVQLVILFVVVANMVVKPTGDDTGAIVAGLVALAAAVAFGALAILRPVAATAEAAPASPLEQA